MITKELLIELKEYVDMNINHLDFAICEGPAYAYDIFVHNEIEDYIKKARKPTFNQVLFGFIDKKVASDSEIYKKAGLDRKLFSKIRSNLDYHPGKNTVIALAIALELDKKGTDKLLSSAGYSLSDCDTFDLVIQFCMEKKIYSIYDVNIALDYFSLKPLSGALE